MTVKMLKEILATCKDTDRVIIDWGNTMKATDDNEIVGVLQHKRLCDDRMAPVVVLQTKSDFDVPTELEAMLNNFLEENADETDAVSELLEIGYSLEDFRAIGKYEWAKRIASEHGLI